MNELHDTIQKNIRWQENKRKPNNFITFLGLSNGKYKPFFPDKTTPVFTINEHWICGKIKEHDTFGIITKINPSYKTEIDINGLKHINIICENTKIDDIIPESDVLNDFYESLYGKKFMNGELVQTTIKYNDKRKKEMDIEKNEYQKSHPEKEDLYDEYGDKKRDSYWYQEK